MTSNTTPKGTCSASYVYPGRDAWYGFRSGVATNPRDGSTFHTFVGVGNTLDYTFDTPVLISKIQWDSFNNGTFTVSYKDTSDVYHELTTATANGSGSYNSPTVLYSKGIRFTSASGDPAIAQITAYGYDA